MKKEAYNSLEFEVIAFDAEDVIVTSCVYNTQDPNCPNDLA